ncbi:MAG: GAF domain-containing protein [Chloroflexi bacterium]|nr:GAF domain-containing protein [Chloroflexota bacterium]
MDSNQPRPFDWPLRSKFSLGFLLTVLIPLIIIGIAVITLRYRAQTDQAEDTIKIITDFRTKTLARQLEDLKRASTSLVSQPDQVAAYQAALNINAASSTAIQQANRVLDQIWSNNLSLVHVRLVHPSLIAVGEAGQANIEVNQKSLEIVSQKITQTTTGSIYPGPLNEPLLDVIIPIQVDNQNIGYVVLTQNLNSDVVDQLPNILRGFSEQPELQNLPDADFFLMDNKGQLLVSSQRGVLVFKDYRQHPAIKDQLAINEKPEPKRYESTLLQADVIGNYQRVTDTSWVLVTEMRFSDIMNPLVTLYIPVVIGGILVLLLIPSSLWLLLMHQQIASPLIRLNRMMTELSLSERDPEFPPLRRSDEIGQVHNTFVDLAAAFQDNVTDAEARQNRLSTQVSLFVEAALLLRTVKEANVLLEEFVRSIRQKYPNVDYAQILLVDDASSTAVMRVGTGEQGRRLFVQGYRVALDNQTPIGHAALLGRPVLVVDYEKSPAYTKHEIFKHTRTELAIPMFAREQLVGILDLHSVGAATFSERDFTFFSALATEIATGLLELLTHDEPSDRANGDIPSLQSTRAGWQEYFTQHHDLAFSVEGKGQPSLVKDWTVLQKQAIQTRKPAIAKVSESHMAFALPVILRDEVLGAIECTVEATQFNQGMLQTAEELVGRFAIAAENARLFEQSQRLIERERLLNEISQKLSIQTDFRQILQVAVKELGLALGTPETTISLNIDPLTSQ